MSMTNALISLESAMLNRCCSFRGLWAAKRLRYSPRTTGYAFAFVSRDARLVTLPPLVETRALSVRLLAAPVWSPAHPAHTRQIRVRYCRIDAKLPRPHLVSTQYICHRMSAPPPPRTLVSRAAILYAFAALAGAAAATGCAERATRPPRAEFIVAAGDSTYWVKREPAGV